MQSPPLTYYLELAWLNIRRNPWFTLVIVLTIAVGIATSMTAFGLLHVLSADPLPGRSANVFQPQQRFADATRRTRFVFDFQAARSLVEASPDRRGVMLAETFGTSSAVGGRDEDTADTALHTTRGFFSLFDVPFLFGQPWGESGDAEGEHVAVVSKSYAQKRFGRSEVLGERIRYGGTILTIVGVLKEWRQIPRVYNLLKGGEFQPADDIYTPLKVIRDLDSKAFLPFECELEDSADQKMNPGENRRLFESNCGWVSVWIELSTAAQVNHYRDFLAHRSSPNSSYSIENIPAILNDAGIVPVDVQVYTLLAFGFLFLCVLSSSGALLGNFFSRGYEIGLRRALGASRLQVLAQLLIEAFIIGGLGGLIGLALAYAGLANVRSLHMNSSDIVHLDSTTFVLTIAVSVASGLLAGLLPAWRASRVEPGLQIRASV